MANEPGRPGQQTEVQKQPQGEGRSLRLAVAVLVTVSVLGLSPSYCTLVFTAALALRGSFCFFWN